MVEKAKQILKLLTDNGYTAYMVGGFVRDYVMSLEFHDIDIATSAKPEQIVELGTKVGYKVWYSANGINHGTIAYTIEGDTFEITSYRKDVSCDGRNAIIEYASTIEEDLSRRDFTMNALAMDINGNIIDPFNGQLDIQNKIVRFVGNPVDRINEDNLRIMRAIRFASRFGFKIEEKSWGAIVENKDKVKNLSVERVWDEFKKIL